MTRRRHPFALWDRFPTHPVSGLARRSRLGNHLSGDTTIGGFAGVPPKPPAGQVEAKRMTARRRHGCAPDAFDSWLDRSLKDLFHGNPGEPSPPELVALLKPHPKPD